MGRPDRLRRRVAAAHGMRTRGHAAGRHADRDENDLLPWLRSRPSRCAPALVGEAVPPAIGLGGFTRREAELQMGEGVASSRPTGERIDERARPRAETEPPSTLTGAAAGATGERIGFDDGECVRRQRACVASPRRIKRRRHLGRDVIVSELRKARSRQGRRRNERWKRISSCCHFPTPKRAAAVGGCLTSHQPALIGMLRRLSIASADLGRTIVSTPLLNVALARSCSTPRGSPICRSKRP